VPALAQPPGAFAQGPDPEARARRSALVADTADAMRLMAHTLGRTLVLDPSLPAARLVCLAPRPLAAPRLAALFAAQAEAAGLALAEKDGVWAVTPGGDVLSPGRTLLAVPLPYDIEPESVRAYLAEHLPSGRTWTDREAWTVFWRGPDADQRFWAVLVELAGRTRSHPKETP
jgi:hypothetical protein